MPYVISTDVAALDWITRPYICRNSRRQQKITDKEYQTPFFFVHAAWSVPTKRGTRANGYAHLLADASHYDIANAHGVELDGFYAWSQASWMTSRGWSESPGLGTYGRCGEHDFALYELTRRTTGCI